MSASFSPERSLFRVGLVAVVLVIAAGLFARSQVRRTRARVASGELAAASYSAPLRDAAERLLERGATTRGPGASICATAFVAADRPTGPRRRVYVRVACRAACQEGDVIAVAASVNFPAALALVRDASGWHPVGYESPSDDHFSRDMSAIFPPAVRQILENQPHDPAIATRLAERMADRFPGVAWRGDGAPAGCATGSSDPAS